MQEEDIWKQDNAINYTEQSQESILQQESEDRKSKAGKQIRIKISNIPISTWISAAAAVVLAVVLLAVLLVPSSAVLHSSVKQTVECKTPEEALKSFVKFIVETDYQAALGMFDSEYKAENFQLAVLVEGMQFWNPSQMLAPEEYKAYQTVNEISLLSDAAYQLKQFCFSFSPIVQDMRKEGMEALDLQESIYSIEEIKEQLDCKNLENLKIIQIDAVNQELQNSKSYMEQKAKESAYYGYENIMEYYVLYELNGTYYKGGFTAAVYGNTWRIFSLYSTLSEMPGSGEVEEVTVEEYREMLK